MTLLAPLPMPRLAVALALTFPALTAPAQAPLGLFEHAQDVGVVLHPGLPKYDSAAQTYTITGSGENMWFGKDEFQFVWKKASGDLSLSADIHFVGNKGNNHRKAVLMIRQSLDTGSPAVDVALHGDGLTSLQFRDTADGDTHEVESAETAPRRMASCTPPAPPSASPSPESSTSASASPPTTRTRPRPPSSRMWN